MNGPRAARAAYAGSLAIIVIVVLVDLIEGPAANLTGALSAAPLLTAALCGRRATLVISGLAAVVGLLLLLVDQPPVAAAVARGAAVVLAAVIAPFVTDARLRREEQLAEVTRIAEVAQLAVLTPLPPVVRQVALSARYVSASSGALIGGDLYAVVETDNGVRLIVGDVRGKGLDAVALAAIVLSAFRERAAASHGLEQLANVIESRLTPHLGEEDFVTAVLAEVDDDGAVRIVSCGHPPPVWARTSTGRLIETVVSTMPFGLGPEPVESELHLSPGDRLLFYTDGLIETRARTGGFIPLDDVIAHLGSDALDGALDNVLGRLRDRAGPVRDDLALVLVEYVGCEADQPGGRDAVAAAALS